MQDTAVESIAELTFRQVGEAKAPGVIFGAAMLWFGFGILKNGVFFGEEFVHLDFHLVELAASQEQLRDLDHVRLLQELRRL